MDTLQSNTVSSLDMALTVNDSLDIIEKVLEIVLPYIALATVVVQGVEIRVDEKLGKGVGALHGHTSSVYCKEKKRYVSTIRLSNYSLRNADNLISTFLHELAHTLTSTTTGDVLQNSMDQCGGHNDVFFSKNSMLIAIFKTDKRSKALMVEPNSETYIPARYVNYHYYNVDRPLETMTPPPNPEKTPKRRGRAKRARTSGFFADVCRQLEFS